MKRRLICVSTLALALAIFLPGTTRIEGQAQNRGPRVIALKGATVLTVTRGTIRNGTVVMRDGKIAAVGGPDTNVPAGAEVVDVTGRFVSPGIIDAHSHIANDSINEGGTTVSSMTGMHDVLDPTDISIYRDLAGGLTTANVLHGSANPIGGKNAVIKLRWGAKRASELVFEGAMPGIKFALGENPKDLRQGQLTGPRRYPLTRQGVEFVIRDAFTRAKGYQKAWKDYEKSKASNADALPPRRDLQLDALVEILEGKRLVHAHCYRADEILMLIRLAEEMGFKIATFQHVLEGYKVAKEIAAHGAGASTFSDWWGYKIEADDAIPHNAAIMVRKGVLVSINSDSAEHARRLNTEAAKSMKWGGLTEDEAFALVTINPAKQLRIDNRVGSLEAGKDADIAVWTHHPLSSYAIADRVYIDGIQYYDRKDEDRRLSELKKEKSELMAAERGSRQTTTTSPQQQPPPQNDSGDETTTMRSAVAAASPKHCLGHGYGETNGAAERRRLGDCQRDHPSGHLRDDRARDDRDPRQSDRGIRGECDGAARSEDHRRRGWTRLSRVHQCADDAGDRRAGRAGIRRCQRDVRLESASAHPRRVPRRKCGHPGRPRQWHHDRRRGSRWRNHGGRACGHEP